MQEQTPVQEQQTLKCWPFFPSSRGSIFRDRGHSPAQRVQENVNVISVNYSATILEKGSLLVVCLFGSKGTEKQGHKWTVLGTVIGMGNILWRLLIFELLGLRQGCYFGRLCAFRSRGWDGGIESLNKGLSCCVIPGNLLSSSVFPG